MDLTKNDDDMDDEDDVEDGIGFEFSVPIGNQPLDYYKQIAAEAIASKVIEHIDPVFLEQDGFEMMQYRFVIVPMGDDSQTKK